jgi:putative oxidoreductase
VNAAIRFLDGLHRGLDRTGTWLPQLALRGLVGWEFFESGLEKLHGENWFADIADSFPFPFGLLPVAASWFIATWAELVGGICLWLGLATRYWAAVLLVLSWVAIASVHWPDDWSSFAELWKGYAITDRGYGNFKLPLILMVMLLPLFFAGAGRVSIDELIRRRLA